jgi:hypothetical protein
MVTLISRKAIDNGYGHNPLATKWPCISWALLKPFLGRFGLVSICVKSNHFNVLQKLLSHICQEHKPNIGDNCKNNMMQLMFDV